MHIEYKTNHSISSEQFIALLQHSTLAERRPVEDRQCMEGMVNNSNLMISAWDGERLVGIARAMTDFHYACYLSDLAVDKQYQGRGIGKRLLALTRKPLGPQCKLILVAAPAANSYYAHLGFTNNPRCWILDPEQSLTESQADTFSFGDI